MANIKNIEVVYQRGVSLFVTIRRLLDGFLLDDSSGLFVAPAPGDFHVALSANANQPALYRLAESRATWRDGVYLVIAYMQMGASPSTTDDILIGSAYMVVEDDEEQFLSSSDSSSSSSSSGSTVSFAQLQTQIAAFFDKNTAFIKAILKNTDLLINSQENEKRKKRDSS